MRLSRPDEKDPTKRRHFEISIDSPFNILSCRATQANISLPAYSEGVGTPITQEEYDCGCPGAPLRRRNTPQATTVQNITLDSPLNAPKRSWTHDDGGLTMPSQAHIQADPNNGASRPIHLLRNPSFNPPPFDDDDPPPPLVTPPPHYENVFSGDRNTTLADYFDRLAEETADEDDDRSDRTRVDYPLTPGGRVNRSMDIDRSWLPIDSVPNIALPTRQAQAAAPVAH